MSFMIKQIPGQHGNPMLKGGSDLRIPGTHTQVRFPNGKQAEEFREKLFKALRQPRKRKLTWRWPKDDVRRKRIHYMVEAETGAGCGIDGLYACFTCVEPFCDTLAIAKEKAEDRQQERPLFAVRIRRIVEIKSIVWKRKGSMD